MQVALEREHVGRALDAVVELARALVRDAVGEKELDCALGDAAEAGLPLGIAVGLGGEVSVLVRDGDGERGLT